MTAVYATVKKSLVARIRNQAFIHSKVHADIKDARKREHQFDSSPWVQIGDQECALAEALARYNPGPPLNSSLKIITSGGPVYLNREKRILLKRAFHDCNRITVRKLEGGRTAKGTYCVLANLAKVIHGPQPMPYFVKVDHVKSIEKETFNYHEFVKPFIPFHLHPSLGNERSVRTLKTAALVGDFVENAVPLRDALRVGQGDGAIFSLFETTLRGLRSHTIKGPKQPGVLEEFLTVKVRAHEIAKHHPSRIRFLRKYKKIRKPTEIEQVLITSAENILTQKGPYHGDLHYSNVMVRNRDAIIIDFGSMGPFGPLYADPAILEVSLVFGTDNHDDPNSFNTWRKFVDYIFLDPLNPPLPKGDFPQFAWLHKAVRELRHVVACCGVEEQEALTILAGCLLRYGRNPPLKLASKQLDSLAESRRAYGLVVAYKICELIEKKYVARE